MVVCTRLWATVGFAAALALPFLEALLASFPELRSYELWVLVYPLVCTRSRLCRAERLGVCLTEENT